MSTPRFNRFLESVADSGWELLRSRLRSVKDRAKSLPSLCHELLSTQGEASGIAIAREIVDQYHRADSAAKLEFFESITSDYGVDEKAVLSAAEAYCDSQDAISLRQLTEQVEPLRQELFRRINMAPGGTAMLVHLRADLLTVIKQHSHFKQVDYDLKHLLASWFNRGFLLLEQIDWETPAITLEKLIEYESVHEMKGWSDLRGRLADDRRCFAFFHPTLPNEPLIFVEVAFGQGLADSIGPIIDADRSITNPHLADTAIFYSINNCQMGLKGVSFGNLLIKQVVQQLSQEFPKLKHFSTLSPVPGLQNWLQKTIDEPDQIIISEDERELVAKLRDDNWLKEESLSDALKPVLLKFAAYYLAYARNKGEPLDPVARFHLRNGASLERINWLGDLSENGIHQSAGILVNYVYNPEKMIQNHESYVKNKNFAISKNVLDLVPQEIRKEKPKRRRKRVAKQIR